VIWPSRRGAEKKIGEEGEASEEKEPATMWAPLPGAPLIPNDADLPF
jgi:hypothetical protein